MSDIFGIIVGNIVNFVALASHMAIVVFRNFVFFVFILVFFYGIFRLLQIGWRALRTRLGRSGSAPDDESKNGG